ncbi:MAG: hypothetical protein JST00_28135 [Deltaproteobacteria bacterium]|nr:hypothetical protein [Deltaproteobacteria bacterium]
MMKSVLQRAKKLMPETLKGAIASCGGYDPRFHRFAGHLANRDLSEAQFLGICDALILPNGTRKTTGPSRNGPLVRELRDRGLLATQPHLRVLDVGASAGLDAMSTRAILDERSKVDEYVLGDLHTAVLYDRSRGLVFDEDGNLLQVRRGRGYVAMHFSYAFHFQRYTHAPKKIRPMVMRATSARRLSPPADAERLPIVHPALRLGAADSPFQVRRMDVFAPIEDRFDLVICLHLLVGRYFTPSRIDAGVQNLSRALAVGGTLLVGAREDFRLVTRVSATEWRTVRSQDLGLGPEFGTR